MGDDSKYVQGVFITLDPEENDSSAILAQCLGYFNAELLGLAGTKQQVNRAAQQFKFSYRKNIRPNGRYTLDHTANLFVIDQAGKLDTIVPFEFSAEHIETLLNELAAAAK